MPRPFPIELSRLDAGRLPALLLGGTNLVRALGLAGIQAIVVARDPDEPALASRYCTLGCVLPAGSRPEQVIEALLDMSAQLFRHYGRRVPLFYGNDDWLELIYAHRDRLQGHFLMLLNDSGVAQSLMEKARFAALAEARDLPVPKALQWEGEGNALREFTREVLVKPKLKVDWHASPLHEKLFTDDGKALVFENGAAAMAHPLVERYRNQLLFQEFIPGDDAHLASYHGYADENGRVIRAFVGRKIRTHPPVTGESAYIEMVQDERLAALGRDIAERIPLRGPFKIDFKEDPRDGRFLVLEVNARCTLWHYLGAVNGVNLLKAGYDYLVEGTRAEEAPYATRHRWVDLGLDARSYRALSRSGSLSLTGWIASLLAAPKIYNVFSWNDPGPFVALWSGRVMRRARRAAEKLLSALRLWRSTAS